MGDSYSAAGCDAAGGEGTTVEINNLVGKLCDGARRSYPGVVDMSLNSILTTFGGASCARQE